MAKSKAGAGGGGGATGAFITGMSAASAGEANNAAPAIIDRIVFFILPSPFLPIDATNAEVRLLPITRRSFRFATIRREPTPKSLGNLHIEAVAGARRKGVQLPPF